MKKLLAIIMVLCMTFTLFACSGGGGGDDADAGDEVYTLKFSSGDAESNFMIQNWVDWANKLTEESDGRLKFDFYYNSTLTDAQNAYNQLVAGVADIGDAHRYENDGFAINEKFKLLTAGIPSDEITEASYGLYETFPEIRAEFDDVVVLAQAQCGPGNYEFMTVNKKVEKPEDLKGMTIWCEADWNDFITGCGAIPVNTPWSEVYSSLQKNMYDGLFIAMETIESCNFAEVCKYVTCVDVSFAAGAGYIMNKDKFESLPQDLQDLILSEEMSSFVENANLEDGKELRDSSMEWAEENYGTTFIEITDEAREQFNSIMNDAKKVVADSLDEKGLPGTSIVEYVANWGKTN